MHLRAQLPRGCANCQGVVHTAAACWAVCLPLTCLQAGIASGALASAAVGATNVLGTLIATGLIEGAGRKQLLTASYLGMAATMALMAAGFGLPALAPYRWVLVTVMP